MIATNFVGHYQDTGGPLDLLQPWGPVILSQSVVVGANFKLGLTS